MTIYSPTPQNSSNGKYPRKHIVLAAAVGVLLGFALSVAPQSDASAKRMVVKLSKPVTSSISGDVGFVEDALEGTDSGIPNTALAPSTPPANALRTIEVQPGDSLSHIFQRAGLSAIDLDAIMAKGKLVSALKQLHPGQTFTIERTPEGALSSMKFAANRTETLLITKKDDGSYDTRWDIKEPVPFTTYTQGTIRSSLFQAAQQAGLNNVMTLELAKIFGWDIDFALDIRAGDSFKVIYEELYIDGQKVRDGRILAAEFVNQGKKYSAVRFERKDGSFDYFSAEGNTLKKAFLRTPVDFARISSHFNLSRMHPVLHTIRAHKGTDYAAGYGTPIKAAGDGSVKLAGRQGGYGNVVIVDHGRGYQSLYAHMQKFGAGIRNGVRVRQGQIIGYVGSSGLATGPHLHYEFHVNGQVRNPVTVALPESLPITGPDRVAFNKQSKGVLKQMATFAGAFENSSIALTEH